MVDEASRQTLRALAQQFRRGAAQDEKARRFVRPVHENPQNREQVGNSLDLVDDDQSAQRLQGQHGVGQAGLILRILQVDVLHVSGPNLRQAAGQRRLANLSGADGTITETRLFLWNIGIYIPESRTRILPHRKLYCLANWLRVRHLVKP
jgi:hypothetical protein